MDSLNFERVTHFDSQPLSCAVTRLSPAKSIGSIDQFTHHHGKGDSAYSSFSAGSTAPDYSSPFLPEDIHLHSVHYADQKYVKAIYSPGVHSHNSKSMDQLFQFADATSEKGSHNLRRKHQSQEPLTQPPPPPPARLDSLIAIKNMENYSTSFESQLGKKMHRRSQTSSSDLNLVYGQRISQPIFGSQVDLDSFSQTSKKQKFFNRSPPGFANSTDQDINRPQFQRKRSNSSYGLYSEQKVNRDAHCNVQHKGQYYFITGVCKPLDSDLKEVLSEVKEVENIQSSEVPLGVEHGSDLNKNVLHGQNNCNAQSEALALKQAKEHQKKSAYGPSHLSDQGFHSLESLEKNLQAPDRESANISSRHHSNSHHIFYCGPANVSLGSTVQTKGEREPAVPKGKRRSLGDVATQKINKETTPLLYHLTGANREALTRQLASDCDTSANKRDSQQFSSNQWKQSKDDTLVWEESPSCAKEHQGEDTQEQTKDLCYSNGTLDDSYKKYYKEKLKDAQSKVLKETSFKRKDLQLSWPHRIKQRPEFRPSVLHFVSSLSSFKKNPDTITDIPMSSESRPEAQEKENGNNIECLVEEEKGKPCNFAQPQVARVKGRKRMTPDMKKLCYSEPDKLNQLELVPTHATCNSLGNEKEVLMSQEDLCEHGIVASRKQMFETRSRAFSTSGITKTTLKQIQHKALVDYMERKTGKATEPHQPAPQVPSQRHSTAGRPSDSVLRPHSGNVASGKKLQRPHSAGRILDSSSSSIRYAQFNSNNDFPAGENVFGQQARVLSASTEDLLDRKKQGFSRVRSISTPQSSQNEKPLHDHSPYYTSENCSQKAEGEARPTKKYTPSLPEGQRTRMIAPRGKSMEELGVTQVEALPVVSKSTEQLDQLGSKLPRSGRQKSSFWKEVEKKPPHVQRKPLLKQDSAPQLDITESTMTLSRALNSAAPSQLSSQRSSLSGSTKSSPLSSVSAEGSVFYFDALQQAVSYSHAREANKSSSTSPTSPNRLKMAPPVHSLLLEHSSKDQKEIMKANTSHELSRDVTKDSNSWPITGDVKKKEEGVVSPNATSESERIVVNSATSRVGALADMTPPVLEVENSQNAKGNFHGPVKEKEVNEETSVRKMQPESKGKRAWEELVEEVVAEDKTLARVLLPVTNRKTAVMLMEQLLSEDTLLMEEHYKKKNAQHTDDSHQTVQDEGPSQTEEDIIEQAKGMNVTGKKKLLMAVIKDNLKSLEQQRVTLQDEVQTNAQQGGAVDTLVQTSCLPAEFDRYSLFIGDLERVVNLLLCLSARLARVQNALSTVDDQTDAEEKQSLDNRHRLLCKQREDAKDLKENLDRRERVVSAILTRYLTAEQLQDYRHYVQTKASLLIGQKELEEKQRLGEEQLEWLFNSLPMS